MLNPVRLVAIILTALAMAAGFAHLFELPNKIRLPREEYLTVQQIYRGWSLLGIVVVGALASTLALAIIVREQRRTFIGALVALSCLAGAQIIFWVFTYPVNQATINWTVAPENWQELRARWEISHAVAACLAFAALVALVWSSLSPSPSRGLATLFSASCMTRYSASRSRAIPRLSQGHRPVARARDGVQRAPFGRRRCQSESMDVVEAGGSIGRSRRLPLYVGARSRAAHGLSPWSEPSSRGS